MSIFKIKLQPIVKEKEWDVKYIGAGRKEKVCAICGRHIPVGDKATTFTKITEKGAKKQFLTHNVCGGSAFAECTLEMARRLQIELP